MRRRYLLVGTGLAAMASRVGRAQMTANGDRLVLLGTKGGPSLRDPKQLPSSNLLAIGGTPYLIDAGYGASYRLIEKRVDLPSIRTIFITHHHSDHNLDLGPLLYNGWVNGQRQTVDVYGPRGLDHLLQSYWDSNAIDINVRIADEGRPDPRQLVLAHEYGEGLIADDGNVRVSALRNLHPPIESYSLKFETRGGKVIVFSGDTTYFPPLAAFAQGADVLVHEVQYGPALDRLVQINPNAARLMKHLRASHTMTEDVGRIAAEARVKLLVLNHFVPGGDPSVSDEDWLSGVRAQYTGKVMIGHDGLEIGL